METGNGKYLVAKHRISVESVGVSRSLVATLRRLLALESGV